ncbi:hypothetical protein SAMN05421821_101335 [Mucilaginibacter lappiensis]|uniref:Uncharacterized protein n=1 Tax=Mucilaginibacter lappiensis TaxID=354630 RepID=A0ABR6PDB3_9SPHI|nr:hypothetical protein [Mucilaginibacter lappiensis]MBB6107750.1 hypothetical protein [Mucilaginibacter lappiensis]SIP98307.1 hypothetical protein SAMN05421821_101335 [Mucilaginibacter lappiensis]
MKNNKEKTFKKKINKIYSFRLSENANSSETTVGDPTNTVITVLTTVSRPTHLNQASDQALLRF